MFQGLVPWRTAIEPKTAVPPGSCPKIDEPVNKEEGKDWNATTEPLFTKTVPDTLWFPEAVVGTAERKLAMLIMGL